jgi:hypothetical protein
VMEKRLEKFWCARMCYQRFVPTRSSLSRVAISSIASCEVQCLSDSNDIRNQQPRYIIYPGVVLMLALRHILELAE